MSYPHPTRAAQHGREQGIQQKGSVKAARERARAEQQYIDAHFFDRRSHPTPLMSQHRLQASHTPPSPAHHWPLPDDAHVVHVSPLRQKGPPPRRPPRPSYVSPILDPVRPDPNLLAPPPVPARRREPGSASFSDYDGRLVATSSVASFSSFGSFSDLPIPDMPQPRKGPSLGPPPSARRGPSSYYSQTPYVSPIVEEAESNRRHNSLASSNVIPNANGFYFDEDATPSDDDDDVPMASPSTLTGSDDGRSSRATDDGDQTGLVRHASLGKRGKPSLTTIKSGDSLDRMPNKGAASAELAAGHGISRESGPRSSSRPDSEALGSRLGGFFPRSASSQSESLNASGLNRTIEPSLPARSVSASPVDQNSGGSESNVPLGAGYNNLKQESSLADRVGSRRPPRLDVDAVREAEARGSLTSLPDLIRRATRLASNLDRGRTASRIGMEMWEQGEDDKGWGAAGHRRGSSTISDILTSFPRPGVGTSTGPRYDGGARPDSQWPLDLGGQKRDRNGHRRARQKQGRQCCGMPLWCFVTLMLILAILIAAAVVVPVVLIVLPRQNANSAGSALAQCKKDYSCENGGSSVVDANGYCSCDCTDGFTGDRCATDVKASCITTTIGGSNDTVGSAVPSLISTADASFQVPLSATDLFSLFSSSNLSCTAENALVTFNVASVTKRSVDADIPFVVYSPSSPIITAAPVSEVLIARDGESSSSSGADDAVTEHGIVYDSFPTSSTDNYSFQSTTPTGTATVASTTASSLVISQKRLQFARIGVLFVLQQSEDLSAAITAQENLQTYFTEYQDGDDAATRATAVSLGSNFTIDLSQWHLTLPNGTHVGHLVE